MTWRSHILLWLILLLVSFLLMPLLSTPHNIMARVTAELQQIETVFGADDAAKLTKSATEWYNALFIDTGVIGSTNKAYISQAERDISQPVMGGAFIKMTQVTNGYLLSFSALTYAMFVRLFIILGWIPYILPFLMAVVVDGIVSRRIKLSSFGFTSPITYSISLHVLIAIFFFPALYLLVPIPITPLFMPFWALFIAIPVVVMIKNMQRVSG